MWRNFSDFGGQNSKTKGYFALSPTSRLFSPFSPPLRIKSQLNLPISQFHQSANFRFYPSFKMMHMTFYWGKNVTILFDSWRTDSWLGYLLSLLALFIASVFYQYMEDRRFRFKILAESKPASSEPSMETPLLHSKAIFGWSLARTATAVLFTVNSAIGYMLMLAVMSFNGGVFIAIVVGLGAGYLIFRSGEDEILVKGDNPCACA